MVNLVKGANVSLTKENPELKKIAVGLSWDANAAGGADFDLDASCIGLTKEGKVRTSDDALYYGSTKVGGVLTGISGSAVHSGDERTGASEGDDETITIDLTKVPAEIEKMVVVVTIYQAKERHQNFGQVNNAKIHVMDVDNNNAELAAYDLTEDMSAGDSMIFGELYRHDGGWKFKAMGTSKDGGLGAFFAEYGVK